jgi:hypothetical protein
MAVLSPRNATVTAQILTVLAAATEPLTTQEIERRAGYPPYSSGTYQMLRRLERLSQVEKLKLPDACSRYWRLAGSGITAPQKPPKAHALRARPPWRQGGQGLDITVCGLNPAACRIVSWAELDAILDTEAHLNFYEWTTCAKCVYLPPEQRTDWSLDPVPVVTESVPAMLRPELRALAALAAEHQDRFAELLELERVMQALTPGGGAHGR